MGCINSVDGRFQYQSKIRRFKVPEMLYMLYHIKDRFPDKKISIILDNSSVHKSGDVKVLADHYGMELIFIPPYTPSFNGIEKLWSKMKQSFRKKLTEHKIKKRKFKVLDVFRICLN